MKFLCQNRKIRWTSLSRWLCLALVALSWVAGAHVFASEGELTFDIHSFYIEGNTVLKKEVLTMGIKEYVGRSKTAEDVEAARETLERLYHEVGYPTVLVNIPEQAVDDGIVKLQVIESRIKRVRVKGNKYFTMAHIKEKLEGIQPGKILFLPDVRKELGRLNQNPDLKISPF